MENCAKLRTKETEERMKLHKILKQGVIFLSALGVLIVFGSFVPNHRGPKLANLGVMRVVIDPGHGGHDPGNLGTGRYKNTESDISLDVSLKVGDYIQRAFPDVDVIYTRKEDKFIGLKERTEIANKAKADVFISIHCNSSERHQAHGTETFTMSMTKVKANLELAQRENSVILLEENYEQVYKGFDPSEPESLIAQAIAQSVHMDQSLSLSAKIQEQYRERVHRVDRGVKQAPYYVISFTTMPSVLTELGFLTNAEEEDFLNSENGKVYMASAIYRAFKEYKAEIEGVTFSIPDFDQKPEPDKAGKEEPSVAKTESSASSAGVAGDDAATGVKQTADELVVYKIQLLASSKQIPLDPANFNGLEGVQEYHVDGMYKYTIGEVTEYKKAVSLQRAVREKAFPNAFIIAFYKGERIPISEALEIARATNKDQI
ncbi:MAG: N-acetylmuramoyl-L-alanine amidase [Salibacteraceae bacterium]